MYHTCTSLHFFFLLVLLLFAFHCCCCCCCCCIIAGVYGSKGTKGREAGRQAGALVMLFGQHTFIGKGSMGGARFEVSRFEVNR
ncbi:uncharacterized protein GGS25DRAFT_181892 [Hypoxylon fragiforme]|uniref:uncharacterized protein n=1 Tax=Hypoxylon fragiforme TaxID=63214 RepID=UPI0020C638ED|nr:uncharacterized protein GGS25DRAFT_181892 [Hypoxylon fragiforme]KAI2611098.1 hypothetical protein GGS25DRAFT_181892 [Hypoxylon fragiforme]